MNVCAVIAEYNPLHHGHLTHIARIRALLGTDTGLVAIMSGNVVQRGEFPILEKTVRTRMALAAGFDLVFELPAPYACAPAEKFARGAVDIAANLGVVTHLSFGAETADLDALRELSERSVGELPKDVPMAAALPELFPDAAALFTPNNILALEYLRALKGTGITPLPVAREGSVHDGPGSASEIRKRVLAGSVPKTTPFYSLWREEERAGRAPITLLKQEGAVLSRLRRMSMMDFLVLPDVGAGGLAQRLYRAAVGARSLPELYRLAKTKRYTLARIRRCVLAAFLSLPETPPPPHIRLLGLGKRGPELLSRVNSPVISRPAAHRGQLALEAAITDQLALCMPYPETAGGEWRKGVVKG
ncbi:MAG: nucleotidyltransferase family protein [Oscillospiraceae bacterium]|jgi:predicted nucleotidyltransferase|nr:nucleotidyltransferase family protein [Oscillospiraceae bacterium]